MVIVRRVQFKRSKSTAGGRESRRRRWESDRAGSRAISFASTQVGL